MIKNGLIIDGKVYAWEPSETEDDCKKCVLQEKCKDLWDKEDCHKNLCDIIHTVMGTSDLDDYTFHEKQTMPIWDLTGWPLPEEEPAPEGDCEKCAKAIINVAPGESGCKMGLCGPNHCRSFVPMSNMQKLIMN